jgi:hypothetical protein
MKHLRQFAGRIIIALTLVLVASFVDIKIRESPHSLKTEITIGFGQAVLASGTADYSFNGDAAHDTTLMQDALDALPSTGGRLNILNVGNITFNTSISRAIPNVQIVGVGQSIYFALDGVNPIFIQGGDNWTYRDFRTDAGGINIGAYTYTYEGISIGSTYYAYKDSSDASSWDIPTGRTATYVVAASDAPAQVKAQADYIVSGTADDEIQAALNLGDVQLSTGTFGIANTVTFPTSGKRTLTGVGYSTIVVPSGALDPMFKIWGTATGSANHIRDMEISELTIDSDRASAVDIFGIKWAHNIIFKDLAITDIKGSCFDSAEGDDITLQTVAIGSCGDNGSPVLDLKDAPGGSSSNAWRISNLWITNPYGEVIISMSGTTSECSIVGSKLHHTATSQTMISVNGTSSSCKDIIIANTNFSASSGAVKDIYVGRVLGLVITGNIFDTSATDNIYVDNSSAKVSFTANFLRTAATSDGVHIVACAALELANNIFAVTGSGAYTPLNGSATSQIVRSNQGYVTENSGTATMLINTGSIVVSHGLATTPTRVQITATSNPGIADSFWADTYGATQFTIHATTNVTSATTFDWKAVIGEGN